MLFENLGELFSLEPNRFINSMMGLESWITAFIWTGLFFLRQNLMGNGNQK